MRIRGITEEKLWQLHKLMMKTYDHFSYSIYRYSPIRIQKDHRNDDAWYFETIDEAIDFLDPPEPPTSDEWYEAFKLWEQRPIEDIRGGLEKLTMLARRYEKSIGKQNE